MRFLMRDFGVKVNVKASANIEREVNRRLTDQLIREAYADIVLLNRTTETWNTSFRPEFVFETYDYGGEIGIQISTDDPVWNYLNGGTYVKRITGTWTNKTKVGFLGSISGTREVYPSKTKYLPGIEAREWYVAVIKARRQYYTYNLRRLIARLANAGIFASAEKFGW